MTIPIDISGKDIIMCITGVFIGAFPWSPNNNFMLLESFNLEMSFLSKGHFNGRQNNVVMLLTMRLGAVASNINRNSPKLREAVDQQCCREIELTFVEYKLC